VHGSGLWAWALLQHQSTRRIWKTATADADLPELLRDLKTALRRTDERLGDAEVSRDLARKQFGIPFRRADAPPVELRPDSM